MNGYGEDVENLALAWTSTGVAGTRQLPPQPGGTRAVEYCWKRYLSISRVSTTSSISSPTRLFGSERAAQADVAPSASSTITANPLIIVAMYEKVRCSTEVGFQRCGCKESN